jgi:hypothetical protein
VIEQSVDAELLNPPAQKVIQARLGEAETLSKYSMFILQ